MTTGLEEELTHTLAGAADRAPEPDESFVAGVHRRRRARKHRRIAAVAACAAVVVGASGLAAVRLSPSAEEELPVATWSGTVPDFDNALSPDKVWPDAVRRLPAKLPNGSDYQVYAVLGNDRYLVRLVSWEAPTVEQLWAPWVFDAKTGTLTFLGQEQKPKSYSSSSDGWATAVGEHAIWFGGYDDQEAGTAIWVARLDGQGEPRRLADMPRRTFGLALYGVTKDAVYWYTAAPGEEGPAGVYRVPLAGGAPQLVPGSEGYAAIGISPWVDTKERFPPGEGPDPQSGELWNLDTGERRPWHKEVAGARSFSCGPLQCTGLTPGGRHFVQRPDGTRLQELSYPEDDFHPGFAAGGRFGLGTVETVHGNVWYAWDLVTGRAGVVSAESPPGRDQIGKPGFTPATHRGFEDSTLQWPADEQTIYVLDLKAIP